MLDLLSGFIVELRNAGLPVSLTENLDAMEAVQHIPIEDRDVAQIHAIDWYRSCFDGDDASLRNRDDTAGHGGAGNGHDPARPVAIGPSHDCSGVIARGFR